MKIPFHRKAATLQTTTNLEEEKKIDVKFTFNE